MARVFIGLGSNLSAPLEQVKRAVDELAMLPQSTLLGHSSWYGSTAVGPGEQPDYVNGVALLQSNLAPEPLLDALQAIELAHERVRELRWGARTLDLDILLYGDETVDSPRLQIPHPWLKQRNFVVVPLAELAPDLRLPDGTAVKSLAQRLSAEGLWRLPDS